MAYQTWWQRHCTHPEIRTWYGGGRWKAQCQLCLRAGLEQTLRRERKERLAKLEAGDERYGPGDT